jgi:hypothetical protein
VCARARVSACVCVCLKMTNLLFSKSLRACQTFNDHPVSCEMQKRTLEWRCRAHDHADFFDDNTCCSPWASLVSRNSTASQKRVKFALRSSQRETGLRSALHVHLPAHVHLGFRAHDVCVLPSTSRCKRMPNEATRPSHTNCPARCTRFRKIECDRS